MSLSCLAMGRYETIRKAWDSLGYTYLTTIILAIRELSCCLLGWSGREVGTRETPSPQNKQQTNKPIKQNKTKTNQKVQWIQCCTETLSTPLRRCQSVGPADRLRVLTGSFLAAPLCFLGRVWGFCTQRDRRFSFSHWE